MLGRKPPAKPAAAPPRAQDRGQGTPDDKRTGVGPHKL
jgi:hypothetical protein